MVNISDLEAKVMVAWPRLVELFNGHSIHLDSTEYPSIRQVFQGIVQPDIATLFEGGYINAAIGIPGLEPPRELIAAQKAALDKPGVASRYPNFEGLMALKIASASFSQAFYDLPEHELEPNHYIPTIGGMQGGNFSILFSHILGGYREIQREAVDLSDQLANLEYGQTVPNELLTKAKAWEQKKKTTKKSIVFIDPGFPVNKVQCEMGNVPFTSIDMADETWMIRLMEECEKGDVAGILYSNPNNPTGNILGDKQLRQLADTCINHDVIAIEDLAYLFMDYTDDFSVPNSEPYMPTISRFMKDGGKYIMLLSMSKLFAFAGEGVGVAKISKSLYDVPLDDVHLPVMKASGARVFGDLFPLGIYGDTARVGHSAQHATAEIVNMATRGELAQYFKIVLEEYGFRIGRGVNEFERSGFRLAYEIPRKGNKVGSSMYFTIEHEDYPHGGELLKDLLCFGIAVSPVKPCGGKKNAIRFSISDVHREKLDHLARRLEHFAQFRQLAKDVVSEGVSLEDTYAINLGR